MRGIFPAFAVAAALAALPGCASVPPAGSIGAVVIRSKPSGAVRVREVHDPRSGLREGDRIKMIDGVLVDDLPSERVQTLLRGPVGTVTSLTVLRANQVLYLEVIRTPLVPRNRGRPRR